MFIEENQQVTWFFRVWLGCERSVAEVWLVVANVTDGHRMANYILALAAQGL